MPIPVYSVIKYWGKMHQEIAHKATGVTDSSTGVKLECQIKKSQTDSKSTSCRFNFAQFFNNAFVNNFMRTISRTTRTANSCVNHVKTESPHFHSHCPPDFNLHDHHYVNSQNLEELQESH